MNYNVAQKGAGQERAEKRLQSFITFGKSRGMSFIEAIQKMVIRPLKVFTSDMRFEMPENGLPNYFVRMGDGELALTLHPHAFSRMRQEIDLSSTTTKAMLEGPQWDRKNLEMLLNSKFKNKGFSQRGGGSPRFINLTVGTQVRGFVGRGFKRHLKSGPLLESFIKACAAYGAMPVSASATDLRVIMQCMLPYVFSPTNEEYMAIGVTFSNSDFGAGAFRIDLTVMNLRNGVLMPARTLNGSGRGETHQGGKGEDDSYDSTELSEDTISKLLRAKQGEVFDLVSAALRSDKVNEFFEEVAMAMENSISWARFERYLKGKLTQTELETVQNLLKKEGKSEELPEVKYDMDGKAVMNLWFASNVIGHIAANAGERQEDLQMAAGRLLLGG